MIYVTGDTHGFIERFQENNMNDQNWTENDYLIVCGDFGFIFENDEAEKEKLDFLATKPYNICFCDGNHENFDALYSYPLQEWNGGRVHRIRENIFHLMRGQVFEIEGKKIFTFGGARSTDRTAASAYWWPQEQPNEEEFKIGLANLEKHDFKVDYIITHTALLDINWLIAKQPSVRANLEISCRDTELMKYLWEYESKAEYKHWYFGHWHLDTPVNNKLTAVYFDVHTIE